MELIDYVLIACFTATVCFPIGYIFYKHGTHKVFFIAACLGVYLLIELLLMAMALPVEIFLYRLGPVLVEMQYLTYILIPYDGVLFLEKWWFYIFHPIVSIFLPVILYRRYSMFHMENEYNA